MPRVLLTRPSDRNRKDDEIHSLLRTAGIEVIELPMLRFVLTRATEQLDSALSGLSAGAFDIVVLSSPTGAHFFSESLADRDISPASFPSTDVGAIGRATAHALESHGIGVTLPLPQTASGRGFVEMLDPGKFSERRVLLLQSQIGLDHLSAGLSSIGAIVERVTLYETLGPTLADGARLVNLLEGESKPDVMVFFSPSSVQFCIRTLAEMASGLIRQLPATACLGETTAKAIEEALKHRPEIVARKSDQRSLAEDIITYLSINNNGRTVIHERTT